MTVKIPVPVPVPPSVEFVTAMFLVVAEAPAVMVMLAVTCVELWKVVLFIVMPSSEKVAEAPLAYPVPVMITF